MKALKVVKRILFFLLKFTFLFIAELLTASIKADKKEEEDKAYKLGATRREWFGFQREFKHKP